MMVPWCWCCRRSVGNTPEYGVISMNSLAADNPISSLKVFDLRESMANGGGPACLRLRVVLTEEERRAVNPAVMMNDTLFNALNDWVDRYYRDRLTAADLADPQLLREGREALDALSSITGSRFGLSVPARGRGQWIIFLL